MIGRGKETAYISTVRAPACTVILAGKCGSRRHSATSFSEKVVVGKTSYQMLEILSLSDRERALPLSMEISVPTSVVKKSTMKLCGVSIFRKNRQENLTLNVVLVQLYAFHGFSSHLPRSSSFKISGTTACSSLKLVAIMRVFN